MEQNRESRNTGKRFSFLNKWCYDSWISILKNKIGEGSYIFPFREFLLLEIDFKVSANTFSESDLFKQNYYAKVRLIPVT